MEHNLRTDATDNVITATQRADKERGPSIATPEHVNTKPYGTAKGERKAARVARAVAKEKNGLTNTPRRVPAQGGTAAAHWDAFYSRGLGATYRDRHLLRGEFPELMGAEAAANPRTHVAPLSDDEQGVRDVVLLEVGCGRGSALFPVLRANKRLYGIAFDFSAVAVAALLDHPEYSQTRVHAFVGDVTKAESFVPVVRERGGASFVTACWTLSALSASQMRAAVQALGAACREGALLFVRDFARGDMREARFAGRGEAVESTPLADVYLRGDGTLAAFFDLDEFVRAVTDCGWVVVRSKVVEREVRNRAKALVMKRKWLHAVFRRVG